MNQPLGAQRKGNFFQETHLMMAASACLWYLSFDISTYAYAYSRDIILKMMRIALLHLAPIPGDLTQNRQLLERAIATAAEAGVSWILAPELAVCGYTFIDTIGTDWIMPQPDLWMTRICQLAARMQVTIFLSHPERDPRSNSLHNSVFVITPNGAIAGRHRKINLLPTGPESWATPGNHVSPVSVPPFSDVGISSVLTRARRLGTGLSWSEWG
ncbi:MAG: carbon-nitrogen hydrolase family protein, partial [Nitrospirales bacterium]|nr:carbon-nitrogen hydrolase family protein [Nitrospirales bacterium]